MIGSDYQEMEHKSAWQKSLWERSYLLNQCHRRKLLELFDNGSVVLQQQEEELAGSEPEFFSHEQIYARKRIEFEEVGTYKTAACPGSSDPPQKIFNIFASENGVYTIFRLLQYFRLNIIRLQSKIILGQTN